MKCNFCVIVLYMKTFHFHPDESFVHPRFIFANGGALRRAAGTPDEEEALAAEAEQRRETADRRTQAELQSEVARANVSPRAQQRMRELLASRSLENQNLVERFLKGEIASENAFIEEAERLEREDASWETIFTTQRSVRRKIQELQHMAESYIELIPRGKTKFESLLKDVRKVNKKDDETDRSLKRVLNAFIVGDPNTGIPAGHLNQKDVNEIYSLDPTSDGFQKTLNKYRSRIEGASPSQGRNLYRQLVALKNEERKAEVQFNRLYNEVNNVIHQNVSKVRVAAEKEKMLERASRSTGITLKDGVTIEIRNQEVSPNLGDTVKISRITWSDDIIIRDSSGKPIDRIPGIPRIHLNKNGEVLTLGRFKKWSDAAGAVEKVSNLDDVVRLTGLAAYGLKLEKGTPLCYPRRTRSKQGEMVSVPTFVHITDIKNGRIYFDIPVLFQPWIESSEEYDMRDSLTFGEFVKWWHRYEVEKSMGLDELRKLLITYNHIENKQFGIEATDNPPILVIPDEELVYPDELKSPFLIKKIDHDGVVLDIGKKSFPEFFYWVKNNHVMKAPKKEKTPEEQAHELEAASAEQQRKVQEEMENELKRKSGEKHQKRAEEAAQERESGTILGRLKQIWWETEILSLKDLWNMTKEIVEFVKRKHGRRSKGRYGSVGSRLPGVLGTEFDRVRQAAENEEVNKYKEAMEHWGITEVQRLLHQTNSKDEAKACVMTLVHKGEMRWDDHEFWQTLNRLTSRYTLRGANLYIPKPDEMPFGESGEELSRYAIDALWGEGTTAEWIAENTGKYNSQKNNFEYKFGQLENDPKQIGGPAGECERMLRDWRYGGKYVNPQEYEEIIDASIKYGKMTAEDKMFYIIAGVISRKGNDEHGETLLHIDRIGQLNTKYLNNFPMLDFFTQYRVMDYSIYDKDAKKWGKQRKLKLEDYVKWAHTEFPDDFTKCKPGPQFSRFMWQTMLLDESVRTRVSKGVRHAENMDHDDAHIIIPLATPTEIDDLTTNAQGNMKKFTNEGYMNGLVGFSHYFKTLKFAIDEAPNPDVKRTNTIALRDAINSFIRYDLILNNRFHKKDRDNRARLDDRHYQRNPVVDSEFTVGAHQRQLRNLIIAIGREYSEDWSFLYDPRYITGSILDSEERRKQDEYEVKVDGLKERIVELVTADNGEKALRVISQFIMKAETDKDAADALHGLPGSPRPNPEEVKRLRAASLEFAAKGEGH